MNVYVVDTHALAWFIGEDSRLSLQAEKILKGGELGTTQVLVPTLVLAEITHLVQKKRINVGIETVIERIDQSNGFTIITFDFPILKMMLQLPEHWDIHDLIIAATSLYYQAVLITRDNILRNYKNLDTIWD
jgi:PIN domain nuclease of toxin-antitoxin system